MPVAAVAPPDPPVHLFMPFAASLLYVGSALFLKKATAGAAGIWRSTFVCNIFAAGVFACLLPFSPHGVGATPIWQPALIATLFVIGQAATMYALNRGDVTIATPVVGTKVVFVTIFALFIGVEANAATQAGHAAQSVTVDLWLSVGMSVCGIAVLNLGGGGPSPRHLARTIAVSLVAAACYGMVDTLVKRWAQNWGVAWLLGTVMGISALESLAFIPLFEGSLLKIPQVGFRALVPGALLLAVQAVVITTAVGWYTDTPRINVVYNARGLWSVLAVWMVGHWFGNIEMKNAKGVLGWRIGGAALLLAAILVAILKPIQG